MDSKLKRQPQWGKCLQCLHIWIVIYLPMELGKYARLMAKAFCPACGATAKHITLAKQKNGKLLEARHEST